MDKVNEELKKEISIIIDSSLKNPNITGIISVTKVKTSPDLKYAKVYISLLNCKSKKNRPQSSILHNRKAPDGPGPCMSFATSL